MMMYKYMPTGICLTIYALFDSRPSFFFSCDNINKWSSFELIFVLCDAKRWRIFQYGKIQTYRRNLQTASRSIVCICIKLRKARIETHFTCNHWHLSLSSPFQCSSKPVFTRFFTSLSLSLSISRREKLRNSNMSNESAEMKSHENPWANKWVNWLRCTRGPFWHLDGNLFS